MLTYDINANEFDVDIEAQYQQRLKTSRKHVIKEPLKCGTTAENGTQ